MSINILQDPTEEVPFFDPPPPDLPIIVRHAADALSCFADTAREQHTRGAARGLSGSRGMKALAGAANRADDLASDLTALAGRHEFTAIDRPWIDAAFRKVCRSRRVVLRAAERDFFTRGADDLSSPEFDQLHEMEHRAGNYDAYSAVMTIADAIRFTLSGDYAPTRARVRASEELASLYGIMRECRL